MAASTVMSEVIGKVAFVQKLPMILKATSDDETPTPGYLYQEIADLTYASSSYCWSLLDVLVDRLDKSSPHIKFKVLRVMKFVVENGSEEFQSGLLRRSTGIQLATKFSGPPDQLHGNAPYIAVRTAAKELSEVLFDTEQSKCRETTGQKRSTSAGGLGTSRTGGTLEGFGNTDASLHKQKSLGDTIKEGFRQLTDTFRESSTSSTVTGSFQSDYRPLRGSEANQSSSTSALFSGGNQKLSSAVEPSGRKGDYRPVMVDEGEAPITRTGSFQPSNRDVKRVTSAHRQGKPAGGWEDPPRGRDSNASNSDGQQSGDSTELSERLESVSVEDVSQETKLVEDFVAASEGRPTPSRDSLAQFVKRCSTLNCEKVTELLGLELQSASAVVQMRCLCALEALMREDIASADHLYGFLPNTLTTLRGRTTDRLVQTKASKILRQLERTKEEALAAKSPKHQPDVTATRSAIIEGAEEVQQISTKHQLTGKQYIEESMDLVHQGAPLLTNPVSSTSSEPENSSQQGFISKSLFAGMAVGSTAKPKVEGSQKAVQHRCEAHRVGLDAGGGVGNTQLLDDLLDLSSTGQPTLVPDVGGHAMGNTRTNPPQSIGGSAHSFPGVPPEAQCSLESSQADASVVQVDSSTDNLISVKEVTLQPRSGTNALELVDSNRLETPRKPDSLMSRNADFKDLIATVGVTLPDGNGGKINPDLVSEPSQKLNFQHSQPVQSKPPVLNTDRISSMYPQLAGVPLSGTSAVPLKLGQKPLDGKFAFVAKNNGGGKENSHRAKSFDFVQEAMAASKK